MPALTAHAFLYDRSPAETRARSGAIDGARGIAIVLVVWGHAILGVEAALGSAAPGRFAVLMIYSIHMPLFFFISGLLSRSAMAEPAPDFAERLLGRIVYPYAIWATVLLAAHYLMSDYTNVRVPTFHPWRVLYAPPAVMWFLYVFGFCLLLARGLRGLPPAARAGLGAALAIGGYFVDVWLLSYLRFAGIFLIATAVPLTSVLAAARDRRLCTLAATGLVLTALVALREAASPLDGYPAGSLRFLPAAPAGILLVLAVVQRIAASPRLDALARVLAYIGARTMPIFVSHVLILAGIRIVLIRQGATSGTGVVAAAALGGVILPLLAFALADRLSLARALGWK